MAVDLTRFDFYAKNFMHSDNVRAMSFDEIGQYVFLLCESWLTGKDCTLPEDPKILSGLCRGVHLSDKVLRMFPVVPELRRRRNERLYAEWLEAVKRSDDGRKAVLSRYGRDTVVEPSCASRTTNISEGVLLKPSQAVSNQINPNQTNGEFRNIAIRYRAAIGKSHSKTRRVREQYSEACNQFGEDAVLVQFEEWAESNKWRKESLGNSGLRFFFSDLADMIDEENEVGKLKPKEIHLSDAEVKRINDAASKEARIEIDKKLEEIKQDEESAAASRENPFAF